MNATEKLRALLDERGVEWKDYGYENHTWWSDDNNIGWHAENRPAVIGLYVKIEAVLTPEQAIAATLGSEINGETSDGYHTFNELYHHRAVLFSVIVRDHREFAWKARKHHDGTMYDGMFIVGIETPSGQATYHYDLDPYWDMFDCEEREFAPEWDGHTPDDAIARIATLGSWTLEEENAKLRELVKDAWGSGHPDRSCGECDIRDECHTELERMRRHGTLRFGRCLFERRIEERMRELGIEVE